MIAAAAFLMMIAPLIAAPTVPLSPARAKTIAYGADSLQTLEFTRAQNAQRAAPLILFVHGGGWKRGDKDSATGPWKVAHFTAKGYAFATMDYRLVPAATVEQQAQDVADALAALVKRASVLGIDCTRVVLMGHSAGAHLVALVGTDPRYLHRAGLTYNDIAGIIPIDGAAYDVPAQIAESGRFMRSTYIQAFGDDYARQTTLSPTAQAAAPNAPSFLLLHVQREDGVRQAMHLEEALRKAGTRVERHAFAGNGLRGHMEINRDLGNPDYPATTVVDQWLTRLFR